MTRCAPAVGSRDTPAPSTTHTPEPYTSTLHPPMRTGGRSVLGEEGEGMEGTTRGGYELHKEDAFT